MKKAQEFFSFIPFFDPRVSLFGHCVSGFLPLREELNDTGEKYKPYGEISTFWEKGNQSND